MRSESPFDALNDIKQNIDLAQSFVAGVTLDGYLADRRTAYAVMRCIEIISEASRRLPDDLKARHADIPWREIAGVGNVYRHDYHGVRDDVVWRTVQNSLGPLIAVVERELAELKPE